MAATDIWKYCANCKTGKFDYSAMTVLMATVYEYSFVFPPKNQILKYTVMFPIAGRNLSQSILTYKHNPYAYMRRETEHNRNLLSSFI